MGNVLVILKDLSVHSNAVELNLWQRGVCGQTKATCTLSGPCPGHPTTAPPTLAVVSLSDDAPLHDTTERNRSQCSVFCFFSRVRGMESNVPKSVSGRKASLEEEEFYLRGHRAVVVRWKFNLGFIHISLCFQGRRIGPGKKRG
jgi:hypothetical protein